MVEKVKVLIVEDHEVTANGLKAALESETDMAVIGIAESSDKGLAMVHQFSPDVTLLDLHLPGSKGPRATVESFCQNAQGKVIIFSGDDRLAFVQIVLEAGAAGYLLKSESVKTIANCIRQVMEGKRPVISRELVGDKTKLTKAEQHLLQLLARGMKYQDIGQERSSSPATVRKQCELLMFKLEIETREELIAWAVQNGYGNLEN
jgi:two-component system response regulator DesR